LWRSGSASPNGDDNASATVQCDGEGEEVVAWAHGHAWAEGMGESDPRDGRERDWCAPGGVTYHSFPSRDRT